MRRYTAAASAIASGSASNALGFTITILSSLNETMRREAVCISFVEKGLTRTATLTMDSPEADTLPLLLLAFIVVMRCDIDHSCIESMDVGSDDELSEVLRNKDDADNDEDDLLDCCC